MSETNAMRAYRFFVFDSQALLSGAGDFDAPSGEAALAKAHALYKYYPGDRFELWKEGQRIETLDLNRPR